MNLQNIYDTAQLQYLTGTEITSHIILVFMAFSFVFSLYIYLIYRLTTNSGFYSSTFGKTLVGLPMVTTAIILAMQGSLVISLGMVGALSIVRFRTAIKSPMDLLFLFWSISIGIICGTSLFELAGLLCLMMTVVAVGLDFIPIGNTSYILTINGTDAMSEETLLKTIKPYGKHMKIRTRIVLADEQELLLELHTKRGKELVDVCKGVPGVTSTSLIYHDGEVRF